MDGIIMKQNANTSRILADQIIHIEFNHNSIDSLRKQDYHHKNFCIFKCKNKITRLSFTEM